MAEAPKKDFKKDDKSAAPAGGGLASSADIFSFLGIFLLLGALATGILNRLSSGGFTERFTSSDFVSELSSFYSAFKVMSGLLSLVFMAVIAYMVREINELRAEERKSLYPVTEVTKEEVMNKKWQRVIDHLESQNQSDWKLAIIEADILLGEMLDAMGYHGDTIGDKLKQIERSDFTTIDQAWEAHKVRNQIAHEGASFELTKKEAVRVIELYKAVFEEFFFI